MEEHGHAKVLIREINMGIGKGDGEEKEWVCDGGADYHMSGDISLFDVLDDVPSTFHVKQIKGMVALTKWGVVRLSTNKGKGVKGVLERHEVLFLPGIVKVSVFSGVSARIRWGKSLGGK